MPDPDLHPRRILLGETECRWQGRGACIALLDSGIGPAPGLGSRLVNRMDDPRSLPGNAHGLRVASLCAEGEEIGASAGEPLGLAPAAELLSAPYGPVIPLGIPSWVRAQRRPRPHVLGLPWSAPESHALALLGGTSIAEVALDALVVAAAGHDGPGAVRFPGTCPEALTVGVCDAMGRLVPSCGADAVERKPELLIPAGPWSARLEDGSLGRIGGTSAAVGLIAGLAGLWVEWLGAHDLQPHPWLLRAALLAASRASAEASHRCASADGLVEGGAHAVELDHASGRSRVRLHATSDGTVRIALDTAHPAPGGRWLSPARPVHLRAPGTEAAGDRWCLSSMELEAGETVDLEVEVTGRPRGVGLVAIGSAAPRLERIRPHAPRTRSIVIVGLSASHDASACVMVDGQVEAAVQLERITRVKHDGRGFLSDTEAAAYCLDAVGIGLDQVDRFAFNAQPLLPGWVGLSEPCPDEAFDLFDPFGDRSTFVSHHLCHAFSVFYGSGFSDATVLVADGSGGTVLGADDCVLDGPALQAYLEAGARARVPARPPLHVASVYHFDRSGHRLLGRELAGSFNVRVGSSSLGEVYAAVSQYVFGSWHDGGKLMGLAPYGDPEAVGPSFLVEDDDGLLCFSAGWKNRFRRGCERADPIEHRDLAARVQRDLERALVQRAKRAVAATGCPRLAFAGGLALNCVANARILAEAPLEALFMLPASHDAGIAIGAAAAAHHRLTGEVPRCRGAYSDFLGHRYGARDVALALRAHAHVLEVGPLDLDALAHALAAGALVGWFHGASEFGPRALGHRSILADPRQRATWHRINATVKYREDFRPFAPVVPIEHASEWFELDGPAPYMLRTAQVRPDRRDRLQAVTHLDGSARVQTIDAADQPLLHALLMRFGALTGVPVLLNTSMNIRGQPVVETPLQAVELLLSTCLDHMVLGDRVARPLQPSSGSIAPSDRLVLSPDAEAVSKASASGRSARIQSSLRPGLAYALEPWCVRLLEQLDGQPIGTVLATCRPPDVPVEAALDLLTALHAERLLLVCHGTRS